MKLKIRNDIEMRNILAEEKLVNIGEKMWAQSFTQENMVTPMKQTNIQLQTWKEETPGTSAVHFLNRSQKKFKTKLVAV